MELSINDQNAQHPVSGPMTSSGHKGIAVRYFGSRNRLQMPGRLPTRNQTVGDRNIGKRFGSLASMAAPTGNVWLTSEIYFHGVNADAKRVSCPKKGTGFIKSRAACSRFRAPGSGDFQVLPSWIPESGDRDGVIIS